MAKVNDMETQDKNSYGKGRRIQVFICKYILSKVPCPIMVYCFTVPYRVI